MKLKISWLFSMVFLGFAIYYFLETKKLHATIDEHMNVFRIVREELEVKEAELEALRRVSQVKEGTGEETARLLTFSGEFLGWDGNTVFNLSDGSVWKQARHDVFFYRAMNPMVSLEKVGSNYFLEIKGTGRKVQVNRVQ